MMNKTIGVCVLAMIVAAGAVGQTAENGESSLVAPGAELKKLAGGFRFTEGPAADKEGNVWRRKRPVLRQ
jgi:gluconolactonase